MRNQKILDALKGKVIEDAYYNSEDGSLLIEFEDGYRIFVSANDLQELIINIEKD